jgi:hypothetical protein
MTTAVRDVESAWIFCGKQLKDKMGEWETRKIRLYKGGYETAEIHASIVKPDAHSLLALLVSHAPSAL